MIAHVDGSPRIGLPSRNFSKITSSASGFSCKAARSPPPTMTKNMLHQSEPTQAEMPSSKAAISRRWRRAPRNSLSGLSSGSRLALVMQTFFQARSCHGPGERFSVKSKVSGNDFGGISLLRIRLFRLLVSKPRKVPGRSNSMTFGLPNA